MTITILHVGRRLFTAAALLTLVVAALHALALSRPLPPDLDLAAQAMKSATVELGFGMRPSFWDVEQALGLTMAILLATLGLLGLVLGGTPEATSRVLSRTAAVLTAGCAVMAALFWVVRVPGHFIELVVLTLAWGLAMRTTRLA